MNKTDHRTTSNPDTVDIKIAIVMNTCP